MGSFVLYVLTQAVGGLAFAVALGTLAAKDRREHLVLATAGLYLIMGATLVEVGADRHGWTPTSVGIYLAFISMGVAIIGAGAILRNAAGMERHREVTLVARGLVVVAALTGAVMALTGGAMEQVVDSDSVIGAETGGGYSHLGPLGLALGLPLFLGAAMVVLSGARSVLAGGDSRGVWLWCAGILYLLWPFDIWVAELPLTPALILLAGAMVYFGFQPKAAAEGEGEGTDAGPKEEYVTGPSEDGRVSETDDGGKAAPK